jgi:4-aminobutyrate aminotransferase
MAGDILGTTTYGGNPLACEAALRTIRRLRQESIITLIRQKEAYIRAEFLSRWLKCPGVHRASCFGLLFGVIMRSVDEATLTAVRLLRRGVLCARIGSLLRFSPPLNITQEVLDEALNMITECLSVIPTRRNAVE